MPASITSFKKSPYFELEAFIVVIFSFCFYFMAEIKTQSVLV